MKGLLYYHSSSGNTRLMAQYACQKLTAFPFDVLDITAGTAPDLTSYAVIGFATWTYYLGLPPRFVEFLNSLPELPDKPVFLLSSFGAMPGWSLRQMEQILAAKGCRILGGESLHMPESYPPYIVKGMDSPQAPEPKELAAFDAFLSGVDRQLAALRDGQPSASQRIRFEWYNYLLRPFSLQKIRKDMGRLAVDPALCGGCQTCQRACPYGAIHFDTLPVFDETRCQGCWACFNHCPTQAIYTVKNRGGIRGKGNYPKPSEALVKKLAG